MTAKLLVQGAISSPAVPSVWGCHAAGFASEPLDVMQAGRSSNYPLHGKCKVSCLALMKALASLGLMAAPADNGQNSRALMLAAQRVCACKALQWVAALIASCCQLSGVAHAPAGEDLLQSSVAPMPKLRALANYGARQNDSQVGRGVRMHARTSCLAAPHLR